MLAILLAAQLCAGCFVFEELDKGSDLMDNPTFATPEKKPEKKKVAARPTGGSGGSSGPGVQQQLSQWWNEARSVNTGEVDENMVACKLGGTTQFMSKTDCLTRGGSADQVR